MFVVGDRVSIDEGHKRGTLRFLGPTQFRPGIWAGIELDEPLGKHDGAYEGITYFKCPPGHGLFLHPSKLSVDKSVPPVAQQSHEIRTHSPRRISLGSQIPFQSPLHGELPKTISKSKVQPLSPPKTDIYHSLPAIEAEFERRKQDLQLAKGRLDELRMQISDGMDISEYRLNREMLIGAVDSYDRAMGKFERQFKRLNSIKLASMQTIATTQLPNGEERVKELMDRVMNADEAVKTLEEQLEMAREAKETQQEQIHSQSAKIAELNMDRVMLRKELGEIRGKTASIISESTQKVDEVLDKMEVLTQENNRLVQENNSKSEVLKRMGGERQRLIIDHEQVLKKTAAEMEILNVEAKEAIVQFEKRLVAKDREIEELKEQRQQFFSGEETEILRKERDLANQQVSNLQRKLLDYQDAAQIEAKHRAQLDALRKRIDANLRQYKEELATKDARITELEQGKGIINVTTESGTTTSAAAKTDSLKEELATIRTNYAELQDKFSDLMTAKQVQEQYFTQQVNKLKRKLQSQLHKVITVDSMDGNSEQSQPQQSAAEEEEGSSLNELRDKIDALIGEKDKMKNEKETEIYGLQLRLNRVSEERTILQNKYDELIAASKSMEMSSLRKEIEHLTVERTTLKNALDDGSAKVRESTLKSTRMEERVKTMQDLLDSRSDELAKLETSQKEQIKTIKAQIETIESLRREVKSLDSVRETERSILKKQLDETKQQLGLKEEEVRSSKSLMKEKSELLISLKLARDECEKLRNDTSSTTIEIWQKKVADLERNLVERQARINLLELEIEKLINRTPGAETDATNSLIKELQERLANLQRDKDSLLDFIEELNTKGITEESVLRQMEQLRKDKKSLLRQLADISDYIVELETQNRQLQEEACTGTDSTQLQERLRTSEEARERISVELKEKLADLAKLTSTREKMERLETELAVEIKKRQETEKRHADLMDLAEGEMKKLQEENKTFSDLDAQRKTLLSKYSAVKEKLALAEERLTVKEEEIRELQSRKGPSIVVAASSPTDESDDKANLIATLSDEHDHLRRMNKSIEHEKHLLEEELEISKETLKRLKDESGLRQQHVLLAKAGHLIEELSEASTSWSILASIKSVASYIRLYKPTEINIEKLQKEYEEILKGLQSGEGLENTMDDVNHTLQGNEKEENPFNPSQRDSVTCGVCKRPGHTAAQCDNMSDSHDPIHGGFVLSDYSNSVDLKPYSA